MSRRAGYIAGLRKLLDLLEANPTLPTPYYGGGAVEEPVFFNGPDAVKNALTYIGAMDSPPVVKISSGRHYEVSIHGSVQGLALQLCLPSSSHLVTCGTCGTTTPALLDELLAVVRHCSHCGEFSDLTQEGDRWLCDPCRTAGGDDQ